MKSKAVFVFECTECANTMMEGCRITTAQDASGLRAIDLPRRCSLEDVRKNHPEPVWRLCIEGSVRLEVADQ